MANEVTVFVPEFEDALYQTFDPLRVIAKQDSVESGAKTVSIPVSGGITFANISVDNTDYPVEAKNRTDAAKTYNLRNLQVDPFRIGNWEEFVTKPSIRKSIFNEITGVLGAYATRVIFNALHTTGTSGTVYETTGTGYTNRHGETTAKQLTITDVANLAKKLDLQGVPRDGQRYLVLDPEMWAGFLLGLAAIGYEDTVTQAFRTGTMPEIHGFKIVMMQEVAIATGSNAGIVAIDASAVDTHLNVGYALHKNFIGFAAGNVNLFIQEAAPEYFGTVVSGDFYVGGAFRRETGIGCITIYEGA